MLRRSSFSLSLAASAVRSPLTRPRRVPTKRRALAISPSASGRTNQKSGPISTCLKSQSFFRSYESILPTSLVCIVRYRPQATRLGDLLWSIGTRSHKIQRTLAVSGFSSARLRFASRLFVVSFLFARACVRLFGPCSETGRQGRSRKSHGLSVFCPTPILSPRSERDFRSSRRQTPCRAGRRFRDGATSVPNTSSRSRRSSATVNDDRRGSESFADEQPGRSPARLRGFFSFGRFRVLFDFICR